MRKLNPIIIINGVFLIVMMLLFARFVNTSKFFSKPTALEVLASQLTGHFFTADSIHELKSERIENQPHLSNSILLAFSANPPLAPPWDGHWFFKLSEFGSNEWLAEIFDSTESVSRTGCELVFRSVNSGFSGETVGAECRLDSAGYGVTLSLRSAPDSLIFATRRNYPDGSEVSGQKMLFLRRLTDHN